MNLGKLDRRIILEGPTLVGNDYGEQVPGWAETGRPWARVEYKLGGEQTQAAELVALQRIDFTIRWGPGVTPRHRIRYEGQVYNIDAVAEIGRRHGLKLSCYTRNDSADGR